MYFKGLISKDTRPVGGTATLTADGAYNALKNKLNNPTQQTIFNYPSIVVN